MSLVLLWWISAFPYYMPRVLFFLRQRLSAMKVTVSGLICVTDKTQHDLVYIGSDLVMSYVTTKNTILLTDKIWASKIVYVVFKYQEWGNDLWVLIRPTYVKLKKTTGSNSIHVLCFRGLVIATEMELGINWHCFALRVNNLCKLTSDYHLVNKCKRVIMAKS